MKTQQVTVAVFFVISLIGVALVLKMATPGNGTRSLVTPPPTCSAEQTIQEAGQTRPGPGEDCITESINY